MPQLGGTLADDNSNRASNENHRHKENTAAAIAFAQQSRKLAQLAPGQENDATGSTQAAEAKFVTPLDPVIETNDHQRLPAVPIHEATKLNRLKDEVEGREPRRPPRGTIREGRDGTAHGSFSVEEHDDAAAAAKKEKSEESDAPLGEAIPPSRTNPLFPPLPMYGPPSLMRRLHCMFFRFTSAFLSFGFLMAVVAGAVLEAIPRVLRHLRRRAMLQNPRKQRPFYDEEVKRKQERQAAEKAWVHERHGSRTPSGEKGDGGRPPQDGEFIPTEGGPDPLVVDAGYYARRVGLDVETFEVQTEDGFIIELWHIYNPRDYQPPPPDTRRAGSPNVFRSSSGTSSSEPRPGGAESFPDGRKKYPVLMMHGLLQSSLAFCCNDDDSLAFYLAKSGYDVWLGNNRCGFEPKHASLSYGDPRMWAWNIRQMGVMDLSALISRVLRETGFPRLALIAHSQGTTQTFVALAKEQRPEIGERISVFCALAPAVYAGPLIGKIYFKVMRLISPAVFRLIFGIHSFIPLMMTAHKLLPPRPYSWMGYHVFSFLFSWNDSRWDRGLRDRMFQAAPVYVSAESMRWWLGRECFAKQKCILATREEGRLEDKEDEEDDEVIRNMYVDREPHIPSRRKLQRNLSSFHDQTLSHQQQQQHRSQARGRFSWYNEQFPPLALWVCGADDLVDGRRLLRRFDRGREPHVRIVHQKLIAGYEHLDVIWAMDAIEKVGKEVREVVWRTADPASQRRCRVPVGCAGRGGPEVAGADDEADPPPPPPDVPMLNSGGRARMASISESAAPPPPPPPRVEPDHQARTQLDASRNARLDQDKYEERIQLPEEGGDEEKEKENGTDERAKELGR